MPIPHIFSTYLLSVIAFFALDFLWLGVLARGIYRKGLGSLMADPIKWGPTVLFYLLFLVGLNYFALLPGIANKSMQQTILRAALYGFFTYMTYELTNWAVIKNWPAWLVPIDIAWGVVLSSLVALAVFWAHQLLF